MSEKIYINGMYCKKSQYGIKITGKADKIIEQIQANTNEKGYINLELKERRQPDENGNTHYVQVDTYERA